MVGILDRVGTGNPLLAGKLDELRQFEINGELEGVAGQGRKGGIVRVRRRLGGPVGGAEWPHVERTGEVARRFNRRFGEVCAVPKGMVGEVPRLVGLDGNAKMSKSLGNTIDLKDDAETVVRKVMSMFTDPTRLRATDPGHVEGNPVFMYHDAFNPDVDEVDDLKQRYVAGKVGDVEVKQKLATALNDLLDPIRERCACYEARPDEVKRVLAAGSDYAREVGEETGSSRSAKLR